MEKINKFLKWIEVDRAIFYAISGKVWLVIAGPITLIMISWYLTAELQGYYYTFTSLIALQVFLELGFSIVVTQFASHEWANLNLDKNGYIVGNPDSLSRLISLGRIVFKWYAIATILFILLVGPGGYVFLASKPNPGLAWEFPWVAYVIIAGLQLWLFPFLALLEGCNQISNVQLFHFLKSVFSSIFMWLVLYLGGKLWIAVAALGAGLVIYLVLIFRRYRRFFEPFFTVSLPSKINWRLEIWPMQWRMAIGGLANYFMFSLFTPIMFHYHGAVVAGQMGMTLQIISILGSLAVAWITTRIPKWGMLIAKNKYSELDLRFFRTSKISMVLMILGSIVFWLIAYWLNDIQHSLANRLLPLFPIAIFLLAEILLLISKCLACYLRAHKKEPLMVASLVSHLSAGLLIFIFGSQHGPIGAGLSYLFIASIIVPCVWLIWQRCRKKWHTTKT